MAQQENKQFIFNNEFRDLYTTLANGYQSLPCKENIAGSVLEGRGHRNDNLPSM